MNALYDLRAVRDHAERQFNGGQIRQALRALPNDLGRAVRPDLADHERLRLLLIRARLLISCVYLDGEESRSAHHALNDAQRIADHRADQHAQASIAHERGRLSLIEQLRFEQPDYHTAWFHLQKALKARETHGSHAELSATLTQCGVASMLLHQPDDACAFTDRAYAIAGAHGCKAEQSEAALRLGLLQRAYGDTCGALKLLTESLHLREEIGQRIYIPFSCHALGETFMLAGCMEQARQQLDRAASAAATLGLRRAMAFVALALAEWHLRKDRQPEALVELRAAHDLAGQLRHESVRQRAAALIARLS